MYSVEWLVDRVGLDVKRGDRALTKYRLLSSVLLEENVKGTKIRVRRASLRSCISKPGLSKYERVMLYSRWRIAVLSPQIILSEDPIPIIYNTHIQTWNARCRFIYVFLSFIESRSICTVIFIIVYNVTVDLNIFSF